MVNFVPPPNTRKRKRDEESVAENEEPDVSLQIFIMLHIMLYCFYIVIYK